MATLREAQRKLTTQLLLDKALELFDAKGYAATTIDDIAAGAGTTRTTFYLHFSSKAELMASLIARVDEILTGQDDPTLAVVIERGQRQLVRNWLDKKFDQWAVIRPYILAAFQAAPSEPDIDERIESWFQGTAAWMQEGLDKADRFDPASRRIRCVLAFGQFQYLSMRWFRTGWQADLADREIALDTLTDAWCHLLTKE